TFRYGAGQECDVWRNTPDKTGTPDYINEAAFALDSAYTMMVERFGFDEPLNAPDPNGNTDYYTVLIVKQSSILYGVTPLGGRDSNRGFKSHIEINSDWSGREWSDLGYNERPFDALRVTCSHELFHAVQYAVSWEVLYNVYLDDFPYGWTEGSAVLMEDIAFPEVKDYLQYIDYYFRYPAAISMLNDRNNVYLNSILFKYLYERTNLSGSSIEFIKEMYDNNRAVKNTQFHQNLEMVSKSQTSKTWAETLNGFHAESYFTGSRAKAGKFITDSEKMRSWPIPQRSSDQPLKRTVKPYGAEFFWYTPQPNHPDELVFSFSGQVDGTQWALSALVIERNNSAAIVPITMNENGGGEFTLAQWHDKQGVLFIVTNGSPNTGGREITVKIENLTDTAEPQIASVKIYPNTVSLRSKKPVNITGGKISDVKIYTADGKLAGYWNSNAKTVNFTTDKDTIKWVPKSANKGALLPGTYYITATSQKSSKKAKIMILP
ncbi:MAG: T9SS type A sorting domain-containing protein, partial [Chitinispirillales bacterium]|nr:T9SS type A sorting domain-containing protein [Chitinispirillales bacterium]